MLTVMVDSDESVRDVSVAGRVVKARIPTDAQFMLLLKELRALQRGADSTPETVKSLARVFAILENLVVDEEDQDAIADAIAARRVRFADLVALIQALHPEDDAPPSKPLANAARVRRGAH